MPIERLGGQSPTVGLNNIYMVHVDKAGDELPENDGTFMSDTLVARLHADPPVTDVILISHGYNVQDGATAVAGYRQWASAMGAHARGLAQIRSARCGTFTPLIIGLHWPSSVVRHLLAAYQQPTPASVAKAGKSLLKGGLAAGWVVGSSAVAALSAMDTCRGGLGKKLAKGVQAGGRAAVEGTQDCVFGDYQRRAATVGRGTGHRLLVKLMTAAAGVEAAATVAAGARRSPPPPIAFHAAGHSLGCHVVCGAVAGPEVDGGGVKPALPRRLHSLVLIQGAMPADCLSTGGVYRVVRPSVAGVVIVTTSTTDNALGLYATGWGEAIGVVGAKWTGAASRKPSVLRLKAATRYRFRPGQLINVDAREYIRNDSDACFNLCGGHLNFLHIEVLQVVWDAMTTPVDSRAYTVTSTIRVKPTS